MRNKSYDIVKTPTQINTDMGKSCKVGGCDNHVTAMQGPGQRSLCREHQLQQREYGGMGRVDRPHTFHRDWVCIVCNYNALDDPRLQDIDDEMTKRRVARTIMHGDHSNIRKADGGSDNADNIDSLCTVCHAKKTILNQDNLRRNTTQ